MVASGILIYVRDTSNSEIRREEMDGWEVASVCAAPIFSGFKPSMYVNHLSRSNESDVINMV